MDALRNLGLRHTPQTEQADARQVPNHAGGYGFVIDDVTRLRRFLTLGVDGGTYYVGARELGRKNADVVARLAEQDPDTMVDTIVDVSQRGAAPRVQPALFALAYAAALPQSSGRALAALPLVARTGTHLLWFAAYADELRGWGRGLRRAVADWYLTKDADAVAYQVTKYRHRDGWTHRDLLRLAHPRAALQQLQDTFAWIVNGSLGEQTPQLIRGFVAAQQATDAGSWARLVREHRLTWEMLPDAALAERDVWEALLDNGVPITALIRQLPRLTRLGLLPQHGGRTDEVIARITDADVLRRGRVHPVNVFVAQRTYASGRSRHGSGAWEPTQRVADALDAAFYAAFGAVRPSGTRTLVAVDVSSSMDWRAGRLPATAREISAVLSLVQLATEPQVSVVGFADGDTFDRADLRPLRISPRQRLDDVVKVTQEMPFGGTDCALPMIHATRQGLEVDTFVVYTDNETWAGQVHPHQALADYRRHSGIPAKLVVAAMTATKISLAVPDDPGMLDVAGFDASVPNLIADFARGL